MKRIVRVLHIMSGDLWAGAEAQSYTLIACLARTPGTVVGAVVMNPGTLAEKLRALGIDVEVFDETQLDSLRIALRMRQFIRDWRPDVIHTHRDKENILGSIANWLTRRAPAVRTVHGGEEQRGGIGWRARRRRMIMATDRWIQRASGQTIIAVSSALGVMLTERYPGQRIVVIENGIDVEGLRAQVGAHEVAVVSPDTTHIGIVGRLAAVKRVDLFLEMARRLLTEEPTRAWRFEVIGEGPERGKLMALCDRLQIRGCVTFHGHVEDVATRMRGLDVLVMCSDHEGMPMAALEAAALGVPTVAHAVGGLIDVVPKEFLVTRHDALGYGTAVRRALQRDARDLVSTHVAGVLERFSAERNCERTLAVYRDRLGYGVQGWVTG